MLTAGLVVLLGCGSSRETFDHGDGGGAGSDATAGGDVTSFTPPDGGTFAGDGGDSGALPACNPMSTDLAGCNCPSIGTTRACYTGGPGDARRRHSARTGCRRASPSNEFGTWSACTGAVVPAPERLRRQRSTRTATARPGATTPSARTTPRLQHRLHRRPDAPLLRRARRGTENVGACKDGTQTCAAASGARAPARCSRSRTRLLRRHRSRVQRSAGCLATLPVHHRVVLPVVVRRGGRRSRLRVHDGLGRHGDVPPGRPLRPQGRPPGHRRVLPVHDEHCGDYNCCGESVCAGNSACSNMTCDPPVLVQRARSAPTATTSPRTATSRAASAPTGLASQRFASSLASTAMRRSAPAKAMRRSSGPSCQAPTSIVAL